MNESSNMDEDLIQVAGENYSRKSSGKHFPLLENTNITTLLVAGLGLILALVLILGFVAYSQASRIWEQTQGMYEHPLQIRRAVSELTLDMLNLRQSMDEILNSTDPEQREAQLRSNKNFEVNAQKQLDIISKQYLGPASDVETMIKSYNAWIISRNETINLVRENKMDEARQRFTPGGENFVLMQETLSGLNTISNYAIARGDKFYQDALDQFNTLRTRLTILLIFIGIITLLTSFLMVRNIRSPLKELLQTSQRFQQGDYEARSHYVSGNEFGQLAVSLNRQADIIQADLTNKKNIVSLTTSMLDDRDLLSLSKNMLSKLIQLTDSNMGAVYLLSANHTLYEHFSSIGMDSSALASFSALAYEGEFGKTFLDGEIQHIRDIPAESAISLRTVSADFKPREIITIPLKLGNEIPALISIASLHSYKPNVIRFIRDVQSMLTARLNGAMANEQIRKFSMMLEDQNRELQAQQREQEMLTRELNEQNIELEQQKKQLSQVNQIKSTFISSMSHELRTPLNSIIALSGVLNRRLKGGIPDEEYSYLEVIERNGKNLLNLINDVLDISRLEAGKQEVILSRFSIGELIEKVTEMILPQARQKEIKLITKVPLDLPLIISDQALCEHILQNLISNAVKFTEIGYVEVRGSQVGGNVQIDVIDTGIGILAENLPHIFDEFRQGDEGNTRKYGGTGLGLSIVRRYTDLIRGNLQVHSEPGKGTTFRLTLPIALDPAAYEEDDLEMESWYQTSGDIQSGIKQSSKGKSILLVDDNEPALIQLTDILSGQGYTLQVARNGNEALEQMNTHLPDAIILDLMMPKMDGFEVLSRLRGTEKTSALPVLILSAKHISKEELKFLKKNNVHQLIQKGNISRKDLLDAVGKMANPAVSVSDSLPASIKPKKTGDKLLILVVEDNPDNMQAARALLQDSCLLVEAWDGQAGVDQARLHNPDLILMDLSLPVMDGIQALKTIKSDPALAPIPVVALTASAMKGSREEILAYGFDAYIVKPIDPGILSNTIQEVLFGT